MLMGLHEVTQARSALSDSSEMRRDQPHQLHHVYSALTEHRAQLVIRHDGPPVGRVMKIVGAKGAIRETHDQQCFPPV